MAASEIKCVVVGDGVVGKTCLLTVHIMKKFPEGYVPTVFDNYRATCQVGAKEYILSLIDTAGQEGYENLRKITYPGTNVFILCFSVENRASYENASAKWAPDIKAFKPGTPIILVACKTDLRTSQPNCLTRADGQRLATSVGAVAYLECSAKLNTGVSAVFEKAIRVGANLDKAKRRRGCIVM